MTRSLISLPFRVGIRCAGLAARGTAEVADRALSLVGVLARAVSRPASPDVDMDGSGPDSESAAEDARPAEGPADSAPEASPAAIPNLTVPAHVSEEPELVRAVAEEGAEDGAGAEVHVAEPWEGYRQMHADDVIDRITGASAAELAAVQLYESAGGRRQTVLSAVQQEFQRATNS
jgi:hypothetical protein